MDMMMERPPRERGEGEDNQEERRSSLYRRDSQDSYQGSRRGSRDSYQSSRRASQESFDEYDDRMPHQIHISTKKEDREREKNLQKKLGDLTSQIQRLERRISLLRTENETLRKKQDDQRPLEEKIKSLKKRNAELAAIARRLEEKAKALQQENTKVKSKTSMPSSTSEEGSQDIEHLKRTFSRQRAKDLAEHAKNMLAKDKEIEDLRRKCQELADQLSNGELMAPQNATQFEEKEELVNIIKQAAKERLQLEQQLAHSKTKEKAPSEEDARAKAERQEEESANEKHRHELEAANQILHKEIEKLEQALHKAESLEQQLTEKSNECNNLYKELNQTKEKSQQLEDKLETLVSDKDQLTSEVKDLQEKVKGASEITEECNSLKLTLVTAQKEREAAQEEVKHLNIRVRSLENLVRDLQESAESVSQLDNERKSALSQLQEKQALVEQLQKISTDVENDHAQTVESLNQQVQELEEKRRKEEDRREELSREVQRLQKEAEDKQKALEEAERLRKELAEKREKESSITEEQIVSHPNPSALQASIKTKGEGTDEEGMDKKSLNQNDRPMGESFLSAWAQKGPIQVYIAKYNYDPFEFSPNENPEAELPLTAGDYVLVVGEMDEDGFYDGELIDGRQGLVPSNFIEKVEDEDLVEFHAALMQAGHGDYSNANSAATPTAMTTTSTTTNAAAAAASSNPVIKSKNLNNNNEPNLRHKMDLQNGDDSNSDLEDIAEIDEDSISVNSRVLSNGGTVNNLPPCPRSLSLDRQLTNSLLISWKDPEPVPGLEIQSYNVYVDGQFRTSVDSNERTKALLEDFSVNKVHRVCVRCLSNRGQSKDAQCTMLVGKDVYPVPSDLKVSHVSSTSASLSWLPGNSNYQHSIVVNGKEVRVVKPGVFRHTLTGLTPGTVHKVTLIAKSISGVLNEEKSHKWMENASASIEFHTSEAGAPEPPLNVQVESGPREGTLLLTWFPVTINSSGICNGAVVAGYQVIADGKKVKTVSGPTSDHVVLSSQDFQGFVPTQLSVQTVSTSSVESVDSDVVRLPQSLIKELTEGAAKAETKNVTPVKAGRAKPMKSPGREDPKGHDTDEEIEAAFREAQSSSPGVNALMPDAYSDSSSSELSDIPEVEEDLIGSQDSRLNEIGTSLTNQMPSPSQVEKGSPKPAPRKLNSGNAAADLGPKEFHDQKPIGDKGNFLTAPARVVPAIEITRDSSTERGPSVDEETEDGNTASPRNTPTGKGRPPDAAISSHYRGDAQNPSAFRQVDQTKNRDKSDSASVAVEEGEQDQHDSFHRTSPKGSKPLVARDSPKQKTGQRSRTGTAQSPDHRKQATALSPRNGIEEAGDTDSISGEINQVIDEHTVRLFIALFDYDPVTMSPNVDSIDEELPFREGQILKVFGDKDPDGFYKGESHGRIGFIPCNMVSEVQIDDPDLVEQLLQETTVEKPVHTHTVSSHPTINAASTSDAPLTPNGVPSIPREGPMRKMIAMYDYDPQELSPNVDAELELSFKTGDTVMIYGDMDEDGFFTGEVNGQQGLVPSNFLQPAPTSDDEGLESASVVSPARSRSGESLDASLNALGRTDVTANASRLSDQSLSTTATSSPSKQPMSVNFSDANKTEPSRSNTASPAEEDKTKKKGGFLSKGKNILKKFTR